MPLASVDISLAVELVGEVGEVKAMVGEVMWGRKEGERVVVCDTRNPPKNATQSHAKHNIHHMTTIPLHLIISFIFHGSLTYVLVHPSRLGVHVLRRSI